VSTALRVPGVRNPLAYAEGLLLDERIVPGSVTARTPGWTSRTSPT
jgi:hypothetical protein